MKTQEFHIDGIIDVSENQIDIDTLQDMFIEWIESNKWYFGGNIAPVNPETGEDHSNHKEVKTTFAKVSMDEIASKVIEKWNEDTKEITSFYSSKEYGQVIDRVKKVLHDHVVIDQEIMKYQPDLFKDYGLTYETVVKLITCANRFGEIVEYEEDELDFPITKQKLDGLIFTTICGQGCVTSITKGE